MILPAAAGFRVISHSPLFFPQRRKLMGSSAQNSSGVHWCRRRVRFNEVPGSGEGSEGSGQGLGGFGAKPGQVQWRRFRWRCERLWCRARSGSTGFRWRSERLWCRARSGSTGFRWRSERLWCRARSGSTGFRWRSERLWCRARSASTGFRRRFRRWFREALVEIQARFNRVPKKVPEKVWEVLTQSHVRCNRVPEKVLEKVWEAFLEKVPKKVPGGFGAEPGQVQQGSGRLWCRARSGSTGVSSAWLRSTLQKDL